MSANPNPESQFRPYEIAIVGNDMVLAALPSRAVQLAHAIQASGFDLVVPASWGEELVAEHVVNVFKQPGPRPLVQCSCPLVRHRLLASGNEMVPHLLLTVSPPVAVARYLRALQPDVAMRITYLGACEGALDPDIDVRVLPADFLRHVEQRGISVVRQPSVFESTIPPDRRRHWSMPGGVPVPEALQCEALPPCLRVVDGGDLAAEVADHILAHERNLIDVALAVGCACAGAAGVPQPHAPRESLIALEPPRSPFPVVDTEVRIALDDSLARPAIRLAQGRVRATVSDNSGTPATDPGLGHGPFEGRGVTPIARARESRAERRRFAVTPAGVGASPEAGAPRGERVTPVGLLGAHSAPPAELPSATRPVPEPLMISPLPLASVIPPAKAPSARARLPLELAPSNAPPADATLLARSAPHQEPFLPDAAAETQTPATTRHETVPRRTPTYGVRLVARAAALARATASEPHARLPRAYAAMRPRSRPSPEAGTDLVPEHPASPSGSASASVPHTAPSEDRVRGLIIEPSADGVRALEVAAPIASVLDAGKAHTGQTADISSLHVGAQGPLRPHVRRLPPPEPANPRRLWGLLASVILIAALAVLLFVVFGP